MPASVGQQAAALFSAATFRPVLAGRPTERIDRLVESLRSEITPSAKTNGEVIDQAYRHLAAQYRSEYVYKNLIASKMLVGRHRAANAALIHEFRVGDAVADCVMINGAATVYEIKTELDNPDKLVRQLAEYFRAFRLVNVVVHSSDADRYLSHLAHDPTGIIVVGSRRRLSIAQEAKPFDGELDTRVMFNALRQSEAAYALAACGIEPPEVPNGVRYSQYLELASSIPPSVFQVAFAAALKIRRIKAVELLREPRYETLRSLVVQLNPTPQQEQRLRAWLTRDVR
ncbi:MAG TPA: sce7726 family protein [Nocardioides sp.]|uniref:sce7726 family protein n=1 Tax=Nocardioides sp. TaxID=35761 RepID=UPI002C198B7E|nr:sce7726 family protein [Nocardioides sp.]HTW17284.1 sce7726 family protein [Nocardioides sp.]